MSKLLFLFVPPFRAAPIGFGPIGEFHSPIGFAVVEPMGAFFSIAPCCPLNFLLGCVKSKNYGIWYFSKDLFGNMAICGYFVKRLKHE
jgi:hypothetical protein